MDDVHCAIDINIVTLVNQEIYFIVEDKYVYLFKMNLQNYKVTCLGVMGTRKTNCDYWILAGNSGKIIIAPFYLQQNTFVLYDINEKIFKKIVIGNVPRKKISLAKYTNVFYFDESAYFISNINGEIVEYDFRNEKLSVHDKWTSGVKEKISPEEIITYGYATQNGSKICFQIINRNGAILLDLKTFMAKFIEFPIHFDAAVISYGCGCLYLLPLQENYILKWDMHNLVKKIYYPCSYKIKYPFVNALYDGENIIVFPYLYNKLISINTVTDKITVLKEWNKKEQDIVYTSAQYIDDGHKIIAYNRLDNKLEIYNANDKPSMHRPIGDVENNKIIYEQEKCEEIGILNRENLFININAAIRKSKVEHTEQDKYKTCGELIIKDVIRNDINGTR